MILANSSPSNVVKSEYDLIVWSKVESPEGLSIEASKVRNET